MQLLRASLGQREGGAVRVVQREVEAVARVALHLRHPLRVHDVGAVAAEEAEARKLVVQLVHRERGGVERAAHRHVVLLVGAFDEVDLARVEQQRGRVGLRGDLAHAHLVERPVGGCGGIVLVARHLDEAPVLAPQGDARHEQRLAQGLQRGDEAAAALLGLGHPRERARAPLGVEVGQRALDQADLRLEQARARQPHERGLGGGKVAQLGAGDAAQAEVGDGVLVMHGAAGQLAEEAQVGGHRVARAARVGLQRERAAAHGEAPAHGARQPDRRLAAALDVRALAKVGEQLVCGGVLGHGASPLTPRGWPGRSQASSRRDPR